MPIDIEYEATFPNVDKDDIRGKLKSVGAELIKPEFMQRRHVFKFPKGHEIPGGWLRVRDESDKITLSLKVVNGDKIEDQKEICLKVDDYKNAVELLKTMGCEVKAFQESKRELWKLDGCDVTIDEWPFLEPYVEVEGPDEATVKAASEKLGFDYSTAVFGAVDLLYNKKYGWSSDLINNWLPSITFGEENPFLKTKTELPK
ncbi:MAG: CYTH domain-containing protein [Patescibacteria group bacterium]